MWDYIIVGAGLAGSVVANRLLKKKNKLRILLIDAGGNPLQREDVASMPAGSFLGSEFDWNIVTTPQVHVNGRVMPYSQGKGLGGGTVINFSSWMRGYQADFDAWGARVGDERWSYSGLLPFMKRVERHADKDSDPQQHGYEGPMILQTSKGRPSAVRDYVLQGWKEAGHRELPNLDGNTGSPLGIQAYIENRDRGRRCISANLYSLDGVTVMTETMVENVLLENTSDGKVIATGVKLSNGTEIRGREVILSAGAIRTPQILMLSGIGPDDELKKHGIDVLVKAPQVGKNLIDHTLTSTVCNVAESRRGVRLQARLRLGRPGRFSSLVDGAESRSGGGH